MAGKTAKKGGPVRKGAQAINAAKANKVARKTPPAPAVERRTYLKQSDVPSTHLDDALRVPKAILDNHGGKPASPLFVAKALNIGAKGRQIENLTGAAIAYGLVEGGAQATSIAVTDLGRRILKPVREGESQAARREALLKPRIFGDFLRGNDQHPLPRQDLGCNQLEGMGVPSDRVEEVFARLVHSARAVGIIVEIKGRAYVSIRAEHFSQDLQTPDTNETRAGGDHNDENDERVSGDDILRRQIPAQPVIGEPIIDIERRRKVFVTHGKDIAFVEPIKRILEFGELEPIVSVERQSVSKPVPQKVMDDMRKAGAAIIHVSAEQTITDADGKEHVILNPNVLIEIGAAMAIYGRRFILLVRDGVKLPSNLQGLYEVRYDGEILDATATMKLLGAVKDIKNHELPS